MGTIWLPELADVLRSAGVAVVEVPGWKTRGRASGGLTHCEGISVHHTAESKLMDGVTSSTYMTFNAPAKPIAQLYLSRQPIWYVQAAGATNTVGLGGPYRTIPKDTGNSRSIGIEIGNNGIGEWWPEPQIDSLLAGLTALWEAYAKRFGWKDEELWRMFAHFEYAPTRKIDPRGPSRFNGYANVKWDMELFRHTMSLLIAPPPPPVTEPETPAPTPTPTEEEAMHIIRVRFTDPATGQSRLADAQLYGPVYTLPTGATIIPWAIWSGDGNYGKVAARHDFYVNNQMPVKEIGAGDLQGVTLLGDVPKGDWRTWSRTGDFANTPS